MYAMNYTIGMKGKLHKSTKATKVKATKVKARGALMLEPLFLLLIHRNIYPGDHYQCHIASTSALNSFLRL